MAVPDFQSLMLPLLRFAGDGREHSLAEARDALADVFRLTVDERAEMLPSGRQGRFDNRVAWARKYLEAARVLESPRRAHFRITERGRSLLATNPSRVDIRLLDQYPEFLAFRRPSGGGKAGDDRDPPEPSLVGPTATETPEETLDRAFQEIRADVEKELLGRVKAGTPAFFEQLVVELLLKMGYGRNRTEAGRAIGRSGDEGIDGIISEDRLGLETIYIQAKRWQGTVGRPEIQKFVGALHGKRARKGVFITTGSFSSDAIDYVTRIDPRVVLIDGPELAAYMLDHNLGVSTKVTYELKRIDSDYFTEE